MSTRSAGLFKSFNKTFTLDEGSLRKLNGTLKEYAQKLGTEYIVRFTAYRQDDSFYETEDVETILADENCKTRKIKRLLLRITKGGSPSVPLKDDSSVTFVDFDMTDSKPIRIQIRSENRDWCYLLLQDIEVTVEKVTQGRLSILLRHPLFSLVLAIVVAIALPLFFYYSFGWLSYAQFKALKPASDPNFSIADAYRSLAFQLRLVHIFLAAFVLLMLLVALRIDNLIKRLSIGPVFYWGDQIVACDRKRDILQKLFWGVIVALIITWLGARYFVR